MKPVHVSRTIAAPLDVVFKTISNPTNFRDAVPHITKVDFLSEQKSGIGTRFRETRVMNGREESVELEITEYEENGLVRMISDAGGTIWDTVFTVSEKSGNVEMKMKMDVKPHTMLARVMNVLIRRMVVKGVEDDMDAIKAYCEAGPAGP